MEEDEFKYLRDQNLDWRQLGYDSFMTRPIAGGISPMSADEFNASIPLGAISAHRVQTISARQIVSSILTAAVDVGSGAVGAYVRMDGPNNRIIINDGANDRILIGFQSGGF